MTYQIIKLLRIPHWIKNCFVFIPIIFARQIFITDKLLSTIFLFFVFSLISSSVYVFNDIKDRDEDRIHPQKKMRPVASGRVSTANAYLIFTLLTVLSLILVLYFNTTTIIILCIYFIINILYSIKLKEIVIVDILIVSLGFILRIFAGASAGDIIVSKWLILTALFLSIFLAANKRKVELSNCNVKTESRKVLGLYDIGLIDKFITISASGLIICYALYTVSDHAANLFNTENLIHTIVFVIFGVFRYLFVTNYKKLENPVEVLLKDAPTLIDVLLYFLAVYIIIY